MNSNKKEITVAAQGVDNRKVFSTINGNDLMAKKIEPLGFSIKEILPCGLFIFAGAPKIGKSWLALDICRAVATNGRLWEFEVEQGEVLYLALEDNHRRLQSRLKAIGADNEDISKLHFETDSFGIYDGLLEQIDNFMAVHSGTRLIVIDTLEHIRNGVYDRNIYASDYRDMKKLREITDRYKLTLLLIHHTRKMYDPSPMNTISGSTALPGATDGNFVLEKEKSTSNSAKLTIKNRDTESYCFTLNFERENCRWILVNKDGDADSEEAICILIDEFLNESWKGTATELSTELKKIDSSLDLSPLTITKQLKSNIELFKSKYNIIVRLERNRQSRFIMLDRTDKVN